MSTGRSDKSSKRKRSTPQKFRKRKLFGSSEDDILEEPESSLAGDAEAQDDQLSSANLPETVRDKENIPEKRSDGLVTSPRGRGRPKGSKNKTFPASAAKTYSVREGPSHSESPIKVVTPHRGRGRPKGSTKAHTVREVKSHSESLIKAVTPHRGRGRPKGSTKVKPVGDDVPKRSRGRPKGSKNKKPSKAARLKMLAPGQKIGRGRPRKILHDSNEASAALTPKRGRGRPKGSVKKVKPQKRLSLVSGTSEVKKRGRPRKHSLHTSPSLSSTPKRPRGRPRKKGSLVAVPSRGNQDEEQLKSSDSNTEDEDNSDHEEDDHDDYEEDDEEDDK